MNKLAIVGAGGHGKVVAEAAKLTGLWEEIIFFDDCFPKMTECEYWPIQGTCTDLYKYVNKFKGIVVAIGNNRLRRNLCRKLESLGGNLVVIQHPNSIVSPSALIEGGTVILAGAVISAFSKLGKAVIVNSGSVVEHDCIIEDGVHISPNAVLLGAVSVGECSWIGASSSVIQRTSVGKDVIVGMGSAVLSDLPSASCVVGIPAKQLEK